MPCFTAHILQSKKDESIKSSQYTCTTQAPEKSRGKASLLMESAGELAGCLWWFMELKKTPFPGSGTCPAAAGARAMEIWQMLALSKVDVHQNKEMS